MIKFPRWIIIFAFMLSIASTLGVIFIFNKILERGGLIDIFTFLTIPLIIGSILVFGAVTIAKLLGIGG